MRNATGLCIGAATERAVWRRIYRKRRGRCGLRRCRSPVDAGRPVDTVAVIDGAKMRPARWPPPGSGAAVLARDQGTMSVRLGRDRDFFLNMDIGDVGDVVGKVVPAIRRIHEAARIHPLCERADVLDVILPPSPRCRSPTSRSIERISGPMICASPAGECHRPEGIAASRSLCRRTACCRVRPRRCFARSASQPGRNKNALADLDMLARHVMPAPMSQSTS